MSVELNDKTAFSALVERHRRELQVHCYRMLGSYEESEDLTQETFLRAWRRRETYAGRASLRAWLYRIATNACLDALERRPRTPSPTGEIPWLEPFPDDLLEAEGADVEVVARETIELAFMVAIQHLSPRPRAVLILRDVLGWPAKETAVLLETSVASVNSALQRARAGLKEHLPEHRSEWSGGEASPQVRALVQRYLEATEAGDAAALKAMMHEDVRFSMPPEPGLWVGRDAVVESWIAGGFGSPAFGHLRCLHARANRQPALANYVRRAGDDTYRAMALDVLAIDHGALREVITFGPKTFPAFGLPPVL